jgi:hypothetical protein
MKLIIFIAVKTGLPTCVFEPLTGNENENFQAVL